MTAPEMKQAFLIELDRVAALDAPSYTDREVSELLTRAQEREIKKHYTPFGNKYREGFESSEDRRKELSQIVKGPYDNSGNPLAYVASDQTQALNNGTIYRLPSDLWFTIFEQAIVTSNDECSDFTKHLDEDGEKEKLKYASVSPITHDEFIANISNPFRKPTNTRIWRLDHSIKDDNIRTMIHELITDGSYTIHEYLVRYIKYPRPIIVNNLTDPLYGLSNVTDCELDEGFQREIISEAVKFAASITQPKEYKIRSAADAGSE